MKSNGTEASGTALVVYESMFGSTERIACAIVEGMGRGVDVKAIEVSSAPTTLPAGLALLVVAGPTHAFGLSRPSTRTAALEQAERPLVSQGSGIREWLAELAPGLGCKAVAVDTRSGPRHLPGSAARGIETRLRHLGFELIAPAESFWATKAQGELVEGEEDRARRWGADLAVRALRAPAASAGSR